MEVLLSKKMRRLLRDREARSKLSDALTRTTTADAGRPVKVTIDGKVYRIVRTAEITVEAPQRAAKRRQ